MGGGILLLAVMFVFMEHGEAIPAHAAVQIASNGTRVLAFIKNVDWPALGRFAVGVVPGAALGAFKSPPAGPRQRPQNPPGFGHHPAPTPPPPARPAQGAVSPARPRLAGGEPVSESPPP